MPNLRHDYPASRLPALDTLNDVLCLFRAEACTALSRRRSLRAALVRLHPGIVRMRRPWRIDTADDKHSSSFKIPITKNPLRCRPPPGVDGAVGLDLWPTACVKGHGCTVRPNLNCIGYGLCSSKGNPVFHIRSAAHPAIPLPLLDKPGRLTRSSCRTARPAEPFRRRLDTALAVRPGAVWAIQ